MLPPHFVSDASHEFKEDGGAGLIDLKKRWDAFLQEPSPMFIKEVVIILKPPGLYL